MSQSAFDDLLDVGGATDNVNQSADPFDPLGSSQPTNQNNSNTGSSLLDLGFDSEVSTKNVQSSGTVEINTNPLYEFTKTNDSLDIMASETNNSALLDFGLEPQKEVKSEPSANPLYDFIQSENTNGHADDLLTNGDTQTLDLLDNTGDLLGDKSGDLVEGDNTEDLTKGDNSMELVDGDNSGDLLDVEGDKSGDLIEGDTNGELIEADDTDDLIKADNTEDLVKVDNTGDLLEADDSADLLGGAVTSDDSGVTMDINNVSENQKEEAEEQTDDVDEEVKVEEIEEDQDTGNVEEIVSEQMTEPETDDQLEDEVQEEVEEGPNNPDIVDENDGDKPAEVAEIAEETAENLNDPANVSEDIAEKPDENVSEEPEGQKPDDLEVNIEDENDTKEELRDETTEPEHSETFETNDHQNDEKDTDGLGAQSESIEPLQKDGADVIDSQVPLEKVDVESESASQNNAEENIEKHELEAEKELADVEVEDSFKREEEASTEAAPDTIEATKDEAIEDEIEVVDDKIEEDKLSPEEADSVMQRTEAVVEAEEQKKEEIEEQSNLYLDQAVTEPTAEPATEPETNEEINETEEEIKDKPVLQESPDIVTNDDTEMDESAQPEIVADISPALKAVDTEPDNVQEPEFVDDVQPIEQELPEEDDKALSTEPDTVDEVDKAIPDEKQKPDTLEIGEPDKKKEEPVKQESVEIKKTEPVQEENAVKVNGANEVKENGVPEDEVIRDPNVYRETREKEEVKFAELNNFREKFETGAINDSDSTPKKTSVKDEYDEGGEFENTPTVNEDVVKETDQQKEELPEIGMAKNLLNKFKSLQEESSQVKTSKKRVSPPRDEKVEYENVPEQRNLVYENKSDEGVFESTPESKEDVVRCGDKSEDVQVEKGYTKNVLSKFKEIETESSAYKAREKRELTPDTSGKVEYVSEPRGEHITYDETKVETGVFENVPKGEEDVVRSGDKAEEVLPESGMAKNLLSKFKQLESETVNQPPPSPKRTTSYEPKPREQKGYLERFSPKLEEGEFENEPVIPKEVVRSGDQQEDYKPESGAAKKTMERFKEFEKTGGSPKAPDYRKEFTPPREGSPGKTVAGVLENEPVNRPDVIRNADKTVDEMPEQGTARNMLEKFKQIQSAENSPSSSPTKKYKEFTPPPESGVYENAPKEHLVIEQVQSESGVLESTPGKSVADIPRQQRESLSPEQELPEKGMARNLVSKFKQLENESAKNSKSESPSKFKEFTPPRDTRTILSPKSPAGQQNGVHPSDLPEQYQEQTSPGIFESNPEQRKDVYRESDTDWEQGLPAKNTTLSMLQKFKAIQEKAKEDEQSQAPITRKDDTPSPPEHEEKGMFRVVQTEKCAACQKTVYAMEKLEMSSHIYHKNCFKCSHCSCRLTPKSFSMNEGVIYCTNHFKQLFARKGNYDEGFGRQQYKKKWGDDKTKGEEDTTATA